MSKDRRSDVIALSILALLPTVLFLDVLLGINSFWGGDIANYYYPAKKILREIVLSGQFPYWNPWFSSGQPFAANPEHEAFYPLTWLILLPRYDVAFHLLIVSHFYIALFGMYAFLRSLDLSRAAALLGALSFGLGGVVLSTVGLLPCLFSMVWIPLTCLYTRRYLQSHAPRDGVLACVFLGIQLIVGEPVTAFQTGVLLGIYAIYRGMKDGGGLGTIARRVGSVGLISIGAALLAAVQVITAFDHYSDSVRSNGLDYYFVSYWSMPLARITELVYPNVFGHLNLDRAEYWGGGLYDVEHRPFYLGIYCGMLAAVLLVSGLLARIRGSGLMLAVGATAFLFAAGRHTPLLRILYDTGAISWLRYTEKFALMGVIAVVVFAAVTLERFLRGDARVRGMALRVAAAITIFASAVWLVSLTSAYEPLFRRVWSLGTTSSVEPMLALSRQDWLIAAARGLMLFLLLRNLDRVRRTVWVALVGAFVVLDLSAMIPDLTHRVPSSFYRDPPAVVRQFPEPRDAYRIFNQAQWVKRSYYRQGPHLKWTVRNALGPMMPASYQLRMAMDADYNLTHLHPTAAYVESAWELSTKRPDDWGDVIASMSNIRYVGINRPPGEAIALAQGDLREVQPVRFIERGHHPRYYFARTVRTIRDRHDFVRTLGALKDTRGVACIYGPAFAPAGGVVRRWSESVNGARLDVETAGRAFLVMSVTPHKYWRVTIDGVETDSVITNVGYQGVTVPTGRHVVEMKYRNPLIPLGGIISVATLFAFIMIARRGSRVAV